jgi:hypothetical protein
MLADDIALRLEQEVAGLGGRIEGAAALAVLMASDAMPNQTPAAFVVPLGFDAEAPQDFTGLHVQTLRDSIGVVLVVDYAGDASGALALPAIDALAAQVIAALAGWQPPEAIDALALRRGRLAGLRAGAVFYQIDFSLLSQWRTP